MAGFDPTLTGWFYPTADILPKEPWLQSDILLHHEPPFGTSISSKPNGQDFGSDLLTDYLREAERPPALVLSGHVEDAGEIWDKVGRTLCLNVSSRDISRHIPPDAWIDWSRRSVLLSSGDREEVVSIERP